MQHTRQQRSLRSTSAGLALAAALLAGLAACSAPPAPASTTTASGVIEVTVTPAADGLVVRFDLPAPTQRYAFDGLGSNSRGSWVVRTAGIARDGAALTSATPFRQVELLLQPDPIEVDRIYATLFRIGQGYAFFRPALMSQGAPTLLKTDLPDSWDYQPQRNGKPGYGWVGPATDRRDIAGAELVTDPALPTWIADDIVSALGTGMQTYASRLGPSPTVPMVLASAQSPGPYAYRGDVSGAGIISLRFVSNQWAQRDDARGRSVQWFVWHEAFHLWNSAAGGQGPDTTPWLHEGGAEYAAALVAIGAGQISDKDALPLISTRINGCLRALGNDSWGGKGMMAGQGVYDCGILMQWMADLQARKASGGTRNVFDLWRDARANVAAEHRNFAIADFAGADDGSAPGLVQFLAATPETRVAKLTAALDRVGVTLVPVPSRDGLSTSLSVTAAPSLALADVAH